MRELTVYYCSKCGHYGYYQQPSRAVCSNCELPMTALPISYQSFMKLGIEMRDELIADQIAGDVTPYSSVVQRITELEKGSTSRFLIARLKSRIEELEAEISELSKKNQEQKETIEWMHDLVWDLTRQLHKVEDDS